MNRTGILLLQLLLFGAVILLPCTGMARPVLLELFVSSADRNSTSAVEAAAQLRQEFSKQELHIIIYQLNSGDDDWTFEGALRALQHGVKTTLLPVAVFNGTSRIEGSLPNLLPSYREQVIEKRGNATNGDIQCRMHLGADSLVASATWILPVTAPVNELDLYYAVIENRSAGQPAINRVIDIIEPLENISGRTAIQTDRFFTIHETKTETIVWIENRQTQEVLHSSLARNIAAFQHDANGDNEWDGLDVLWLPFLWGPNTNTADRNQDGKVNQLDLVGFIIPGR